MRYASLLITLSLLASCKEKPDAFLCTFILKVPTDASYSFCVNVKTKEEKSVLIKDMGNWVTGSPDDYELMRQWYKGQCKAAM